MTDAVWFVGLTSIVVSTLLIYGLLHGSPDPDASARICSILLAAALVAPVLLDCSRNGFAALAKAHYVPLLGCIYWLLLDSIQRIYPLPPDSDFLFSGFLSIALFGAAVLCGAYGRSLPLRDWARRIGRVTMRPGRIALASVVCFLLAVGYYLFRSGWSIRALLSSYGLGRGETMPWSRGSYGDTWAALEFFAYFAYLLPTLFVLQLRTSRSWTKPLLLVTAGLSVLSFPFITTDGSRRGIGVCLVSATLCWFVTSRKMQRRRRFPLGLLLGGAVTAAGILLTLNLVLQTRGNWDRGVSITPDTYGMVQVDDNFLRLCQTVEAIPGNAPYSGFGPVVFALVRPIPRALWPGKPISPGFTIHEYLGMTGVSLSMSAVGELYTCFGFPTVLLGGFVMGLLCRWWSSLLTEVSRPTVAGVYCLGYGALFVGMRSLTDLVLFSYPLLGMLILVRWMSPAAGVRRRG